MNRWLMAFTVSFVGCVATLPADSTITADLACEGAVIEMQARAAPAPRPSDGKCQNCAGRGRVRSGDGLAEFTCPACGGTGKDTTKSVAVPAPVQQCKDGRCPLR